MTARRLSIVGAGRAGGGLAVEAAAAGWQVAALWSRKRSRARRMAQHVAALGVSRPSVAASPAAALLPGSLTILAVPDGALEAMAAQLAATPNLDSGPALHLSGAAGVSVLRPLADRGLATGSLHPLATFPSTLPEPGWLVGCGFAVDGAPAARRMATRLARDLGGFPYRIPGAGRPLYHLAASLTANDTLALVAAAEDAAIRAGVPRRLARRVLARMLAQAAASIASTPVAQALTGPAVRGDAATLEAHLRAAGGHRTRLGRIHAELTGMLLDMAVDAGRLDRRAAGRVRRVLRPAKPGG